MTSDRKKPGVAFWVTVVVVALPLVYVLSFGPACWWFATPNEERAVRFIDLRKLGAQYTGTETHVHAKWGNTKTHNRICVGDIDRMVSQENRSGGAIAFQ